jgi:hypothetical protein
MKSRIPLWKLATLASSILLLAGFVAYSAGAITSFDRSSPRQNADVNEQTDHPASDPPTVLLPGSKSAVEIPPGSSPASAPQPKMLPGSKAVAPAFPGYPSPQISPSEKQP